ncbi:MAG: YbaB/EbfC family nucleoid-associated protein [Gemmatimonadota bacterium]
MDNLGRFQQLFQLSQAVQARMADLQQRLDKEMITARSGGGMVEVTVDGRGALRGVKIDPGVVDPEEVEMLEDLVLAAASEAQRRARDRLDEEMKRAAGGLPLPNLAGLFAS